MPDGSDVSRGDSVEILVGVIGRAHGVRGDVVVQARTDEPELRFAPGARLRVEDGSRVFTVVSHRYQSGRLLVRFAEIGDRNDAESARGVRLVTDVAADALPDEPDAYYDRQLVGLQVRSSGGEPVGTVRTVLHLPSQDVLELATPDGPVLVPFVEALVPEVDLATGVITVAEVEGLLDQGEDHPDRGPDQADRGEALGSDS